MRVTEILHPDQEHADALLQTGFWGKQGAGCIFLAKSTARIGIAHRSSRVEQPNTWGTVGGAVDTGHDLQQTIMKEAEEEVGYRHRPGDYLRDLDLFQSGSFKYTTFLYVVAEEFQARMNWETQGFDWFTLGQWPQSLHFGLVSTFSKPACLGIIQEEIQRLTPR